MTKETEKNANKWNFRAKHSRRTRTRKHYIHQQQNQQQEHQKDPVSRVGSASSSHSAALPQAVPSVYAAAEHASLQTHHEAQAVGNRKVKALKQSQQRPAAAKVTPVPKQAQPAFPLLSPPRVAAPARKLRPYQASNFNLLKSVYRPESIQPAQPRPLPVKMQPPVAKQGPLRQAQPRALANKTPDGPESPATQQQNLSYHQQQKIHKQLANVVERAAKSSASSQSSVLEKSHESQDTLEDSALLKRFKVINLIGLGNYARVYKAAPISSPKVNSNSPRELAIKSINLTKVSDNYRTKFLPRELSILKRIQHANICKIYEIFQVADRIFIVMQFCSNGTIADLLQKIGPMSEPVARNLFAQIVDAVVYLHSIDIGHRDIKVENILLDGNFVPKLTDFSYSIRLVDSGVDRQGKSKTMTHQFNETFCGTLPYLSPEMIRQVPYDSKKTDSWALGVSLYVMLNDRIPFPINDIKLMVKKQLDKDYKFKANISCSENCYHLIGRLLEPDFAKRITSLEASNHQWMSGPREKPEL